MCDSKVNAAQKSTVLRDPYCQNRFMCRLNITFCISSGQTEVDSAECRRLKKTRQLLKLKASKALAAMLCDEFNRIFHFLFKHVCIHLFIFGHVIFMPL